MSRKVDYFVSEQAAPTAQDCIFVAMDARYVPALLRGASTYLGPSFWVSTEDYARGYQGILAAMEGLLMDCGEQIVNNLIALRGIDPATPRDPVYGTPLAPPPGSTLLDIFNTLQSATGTPGAMLERITLATEATQAATVEGLGTELEDGAFLLQLLTLI